MLARHEPQGVEDPLRQRIGTIFQRVVRVAARDHAPVTIVKHPTVSAPRCPVVADEGGWLEADVPPGAHDAEAEIGLLEIVGELLVEAADLEEYVAPEGAVAAGDASYPPRRVRLVLRWRLAEQLKAVIRRRTPGELAVVAVLRIDGATAGAEPLILPKRRHDPVEPVGRAGERVVVDEDHDVACRCNDADVARAAEVRLRTAGDLDPIGKLYEDAIGLIARRPVHHDDLEPLVRQVVEAAQESAEVQCPVERVDDDGNGDRDRRHRSGRWSARDHLHVWTATVVAPLVDHLAAIEPGGLEQRDQRAAVVHRAMRPGAVLRSAEGHLVQSLQVELTCSVHLEGASPVESNDAQLSAGPEQRMPVGEDALDEFAPREALDLPGGDELGDRARGKRQVGGIGDDDGARRGVGVDLEPSGPRILRPQHDAQAVGH